LWNLHIYIVYGYTRSSSSSNKTFNPKIGEQEINTVYIYLFIRQDNVLLHQIHFETYINALSVDNIINMNICALTKQLLSKPIT